MDWLTKLLDFIESTSDVLIRYLIDILVVIVLPARVISHITDEKNPAYRPITFAALSCIISYAIVQIVNNSFWGGKLDNAWYGLKEVVNQSPHFLTMFVPFLVLVALLSRLANYIGRWSGTNGGITSTASIISMSCWIAYPPILVLAVLASSHTGMADLHNDKWSAAHTWTAVAFLGLLIITLRVLNKGFVGTNISTTKKIAGLILLAPLSVAVPISTYSLAAPIRNLVITPQKVEVDLVSDSPAVWSAGGVPSIGFTLRNKSSRDLFVDTSSISVELYEYGRMLKSEVRMRTNAMSLPGPDYSCHLGSTPKGRPYAPGKTCLIKLASDPAAIKKIKSGDNELIVVDLIFPTDDDRINAGRTDWTLEFSAVDEMGCHLSYFLSLFRDTSEQEFGEDREIFKNPVWSNCK